ncbi:FMN-dependent dehydrogenase-domain-containing protein [Lanmaoa asiatica]|nr:FMN-dependent dehydrogenase-domain-containing protein [Lanmaoa asiatica]
MLPAQVSLEYIMPTYNLAQVAQHNTTASCWVIIRNKVYDVTDFLFDHPGGPQVILGFGGRDATAAYIPIHPSDALDKNIAPEKHLGDLDRASILELRQAKKNQTKTRDELRVEEALKIRPPLSRIINVQDMEETAKKILPYKVLAYYASAADDSMTHMENARAFSRFFFHPRVMRTVSGCDTSSTILGYRTSIPVYISGSALARLGHPLGEVNLTRGAYKTGIIQMVSTNASLSYGQIATARGSPDQAIFFQLYKHKNDPSAAKRIQEVEALGYKAIFLTVDALVPSNRELDTRAPHYLEDLENQGAKHQPNSKVGEEEIGILGTAGGLIINNDLDMTWARTIPWMRSITGLPIGFNVLHKDAVLAAEAGCEGIVLSNHGGRQLEYSLPPLEILYKLRKEHPESISTAAFVAALVDVLKALCLGAKAVGLGRAFLYAQSAYGEAGVVHLVRILQREIKFGMESLGVRSIDQLSPEMTRTINGILEIAWDSVADAGILSLERVANVVAPQSWSSSKCQTVDKWSQTYISRESPTRSPIQIDGACSASHPNVVPTGLRAEQDQCTSHPVTGRFTRPSSSRFSPSISSHVNSHISSAARPRTPSKQPFDIDERSLPSSPTTLAADAGILQAPNAPELSKAYGSVLQPKESLATYSCTICLTAFQPDATIFPDPSAPELSDRFLCRPCFTINGGSKGDCPACRRPVLILKSEGGFVETSGRVWHKKCFRCEGCHKNIGNTPMVDLLGQPSCADCFDSCLKRNSTPRKSHPLPSLDKDDNRTPLTPFKGSKSREGSPAIDELEQRLGIMKSREGSPVLEELTQRLNAVLNRTPRDSSLSMSSSTSYLNRDDREGSPLAHRTLERKKSATLITSRHGIHPFGILIDTDSLGETRTTTPRQAIHTGSPHQDPCPLVNEAIL